MDTKGISYPVVTHHRQSLKQRGLTCILQDIMVQQMVKPLTQKESLQGEQYISSRMNSIHGRDIYVQSIRMKLGKRKGIFDSRKQGWGSVPARQRVQGALRPVVMELIAN